MFGRRDEEYEDYNERYAAKFDDDYIAPSHDYRRECTHSHEQTYEDMDDLWECRHDHEQTYQNVTDVKECNHSHEQTYDDADYEQRPYYTAAAQRQSYVGSADFESFFAPYLCHDEHLLWAGGFGRLDKLNAEARKQDMGVALAFIIIGLILTLTCIGTIPGIILFVVGLSKANEKEQSIVAVTDKRIIVRYFESSQNIWLSSIKSITVSSKDGRIGNLRMMLDENVVDYDFGRGTEIRANKSITYYISPKIQNPARVKQIIEDAILSARLNKYE